jgi:hypothetical protein
MKVMPVTMMALRRISSGQWPVVSDQSKLRSGADHWPLITDH